MHKKLDVREKINIENSTFPHNMAMLSHTLLLAMPISIVPISIVKGKRLPSASLRFSKRLPKNYKVNVM